MVRKKREGNETQRRDAARAARRRGESPSEAQVTTGAAKQRNEKDNEVMRTRGNRGREQHD